MSARSYNPSQNQGRYAKLNKPNVFRDDQMYLEVMSPDLSRKGICKYLTDSTPSHMVPLGKQNNMPVIIVLGDTMSIGDDNLARVREFYLDGVLRAASTTEALVVDSGLVSTPGVATPTIQHEDFCRNTFQMGIVPGRVKETLSLYHTQMVCMSDFNGWGDRPEEFAQEKFDFIRRLAGKGRIVCVLFNEGHCAFEEAYAATQAGIGVIAVKGSGKLADEFANAQEAGSSDDPKLNEMINSSCLQSFDMENGRICDFAALIRMYATTDIVEMLRVCNKLEPLEIDQVRFDRGVPQLQLRVREGVEGRLQFINSGKTGNTVTTKTRTKTKTNKKAQSKRKPTKTAAAAPPPLPPSKKSSGSNKKSLATEKQNKRPSRERKSEPEAPQYGVEEASAATKIQAIQRGKHDRQAMQQQQKEREKAATKIQAKARGRQGAKRADRKKNGEPLDPELEAFEKVECNFDDPIVSNYRKKGYWCEIMHVSENEKDKQLYLRLRLHGLGQWLDLPKACSLKGGKNQDKYKMFAIRAITKKKVTEEDTGDPKVTIEAICIFLIPKNGCSNLSFKMQAGYEEVPIPAGFMRPFNMFRSAGPLSRKEGQAGTSTPNKDNKEKKGAAADAPAATEEEIKAAIKMEAIARGKHDRKMVQQMREEKAKLLKSGMSEDQAAVKLEAMARGNRDRERVRRMREERKLADKHGMTEEMAATKVEAMVRGNADRVRVKKLQEERTKEKAAKEAEGGD
jgi:hypothetical protein